MARIIILTPPPTGSEESKDIETEYGPHLYGTLSLDAARQYIADILSQHGEP